MRFLLRISLSLYFIYSLHEQAQILFQIPKEKKRNKSSYSLPTTGQTINVNDYANSHIYKHTQNTANKMATKQRRQIISLVPTFPILFIQYYKAFLLCVSVQLSHICTTCAYFIGESETMKGRLLLSFQWNHYNCLYILRLSHLQFVTAMKISLLKSGRLFQLT